MKGFGIEIKNNLLDPKHIINMGAAVWLYMFLIDKITSVSEEQIGLVLGGKPLKYEEIKLELGISDRTYSRWIIDLENNGYITTKRTPHGLIFYVNKAYKRFKKRSATNDVSDLSDPPQMVKRSAMNAGSNKTDPTDPKTLQEDITQPSVAIVSDLEKQVDKIYKVLYKINPLISFGNKTERRDIGKLISVYGIEEVLGAANYALLNRESEDLFVPQIRNPREFCDKYLKLSDYWVRNRKK